jgi:hypothetical protein
MFDPVLLQLDLSGLWAPGLLIAAFVGGAFGAALGALPAFIFTGFLVVIGQAAQYIDADAGAITTAVAFGPPFSPAISFAGGAAATAYAAKRGYMDFGFDYHEGKNIPAALGTRPDVLAVGGVFGIIGWWIQYLAGQFVLPLDGIALGVTLSALIHRLALGYPLIGEVRGDGVFDMSPFEREEMRVVGDAGTAETAEGDAITDGGAVAKERLAVEPWLPQQYEWANVTAIGLVGGALGAFLAFATGLVFLGFGISAATLVFLNCGVERTPVTHHITLIGAAGGVALTGDAITAGGVAIAEIPVLGLVGGAVFGALSALVGEAFQRVFYAHSDTHWDPPAAAIVVGSLLIGVLFIVGVLPGHSYIPIP